MAEVTRTEVLEAARVRFPSAETIELRHSFGYYTLRVVERVRPMPQRGLAWDDSTFGASEKTLGELLDHVRRVGIEESPFQS